MAAAPPTATSWIETIESPCRSSGRPTSSGASLSTEEESGYYYGFSNEGLALCHIAHVRPTFRTSDFDSKSPSIAGLPMPSSTSRNLPIHRHGQDYHLALLPRMIQDALPAATVITFWHIPWPNPEAFAICPWRDELLDGLLGSSILGFHTQFHCNNFIDTVDRSLEARADRETFGVSYRGKLTAVKRNPISVEWPPSEALMEKSVEQCRLDVCQRHYLPRGHAIGVGVDRLDYTKGIEERLQAVERFLEMRPEWVGRFTFIQICAPTRGRIGHYQEYHARVRALAASINHRFAGAVCPPVVLKIEHHEPHAVYEYFRRESVCREQSARWDEPGREGIHLVARRRAQRRCSASSRVGRELPEAIVVNPYDDQCATALHLA